MRYLIHHLAELELGEAALFYENEREGYRFLFGVVYLQKENGDIVIIAVMHLRRKPNYIGNR